MGGDWGSNENTGTPQILTLSHTWNLLAVCLQWYFNQPMSHNLYKLIFYSCLWASFLLLETQHLHTGSIRVNISMRTLLNIQIRTHIYVLHCQVKWWYKNGITVLRWPQMISYILWVIQYAVPILKRSLSWYSQTGCLRLDILRYLPSVHGGRGLITTLFCLLRTMWTLRLFSVTLYFNALLGLTPNPWGFLARSPRPHWLFNA